jgi:hypothetical protein
MGGADFMRAGRLFSAILLLSFPVFGGCAALGKVDEGILRGYVYKRVRVPFTSDLHRSPASATPAHGKIIQVKEPISGYGIYAEFSSNAIGEIAKRHGLTTVYFADKEIFSILGVWRHDKIFVYGEKAAEGGEGSSPAREIEGQDVR